MSKLYNGFVIDELVRQTERRKQQLEDTNLNDARRKYLTKLLENENNPNYNSDDDFQTYLYEEREERETFI